MSELSAERDLLRLLTQRPSLVHAVKDLVSPEQFADAEAAAGFARCLERAPPRETLEVPDQILALARAVRAGAVARQVRGIARDLAQRVDDDPGSLELAVQQAIGELLLVEEAGHADGLRAALDAETDGLPEPCGFRTIVIA